MENNASTLKSLVKALEVMNCFIEKPQMGVTEISNKLGLYKSNVHNILHTYCEMGYLEKDTNTGKYKLGIKIFGLSRALGDTFVISKIAAPYMQELSNLADARVYLAVLYGDEVLYLEAMYPKKSFELMRSIFGDRAELYCTGIGKAILANLPYEKQKDYIAHTELKRFTDNTITDKRILLKEMENIRIRGFATDNMEHEFGVKCVAVPIYNRKRELVAGLSVSGASVNFPDTRSVELAEIINTYATKIGSRL